MMSKKYLLFFTLLLVAFFSDASACGSRRGRGLGRRGHYSHSSHNSWHSSGHRSPSHSSGSSHSSGYPSGSSHSSGYPSGSSHSSGYPSGSSHSSDYSSGSLHTSGHPSSFNDHSSYSHPSQSNHQSNNNEPNRQGQYNHQNDYFPSVHVPIQVPLPVRIPYVPHHHHHHYVSESYSQPAGSSGTRTAGQNIPNNLNPTEEDKTSTIVPSIKEDVSWMQLSCKEELCEFTKNYPLKEVESAVQEIKKMLSTDSLSSNLHVNLNGNVKEYFITPNKEDSDMKIENIRVNNSTGCHEVIKAVSPLGGYDIDGKPFIIVNVPNLSQKLKTSTCSDYDICTKVNWITYPQMCQQSYGQQELLVLPPKQGSFNPRDFSIKFFKVPNGCQCVSAREMFHLYL